MEKLAVMRLLTRKRLEAKEVPIELRQVFEDRTLEIEALKMVVTLPAGVNRPSR
jgi:hypothetical protein